MHRIKDFVQLVTSISRLSIQLILSELYTQSGYSANYFFRFLCS